MKFKKGDTVIYPQHGACIVHGIKRMKAFGAVQEYLILKTVINEMTLSVPTAMANQVGVRPPVSKSELEDLRSVLSKADPRVPANWSRRFKNHQEKLKSGDVYQVAEVVRNLAARDRDSALSAAEKTMYDRARINLISEISPALKVSTDAAEVWLDAALEQGADLPFACKGGMCCTCKAKLVEGEVSMDIHWGLEEEEIEQGFILTCQSHPKTEKIVVDFDSK